MITIVLARLFLNNIRSVLKILIFGLLFTSTVSAREYHVAVNGNDNNNGSSASPLRTVSRAAYIALPGDEDEVYLSGKSLYETNLIEDVLNPKPIQASQDKEGSAYTWFCENDGTNTYIYANFHGYDPNRELVEINVRQSCFYPDSAGMNYITIRGFEMSQTATQWAAPTASACHIGRRW